MEGTTTLGQEFSMTLVQEEQPHESDGSLIPLYIDSAQNVYDKFYNKIEHLNINSDKLYEDSITLEKIPAVYDVNADIDLEFPNPENYFSKEEYTSAVNKWYELAKYHYSTLRLPFPVSGQFYLPQMPKIWSKEEAKLPLNNRFKTFKVDTWNLLPTNYNEMLRLLFLNHPIDPEEQFPEQVPHRPAILHKHHITSDLQWQCQLIPKEPEAISYDSFTEFEETFVRWATLASSSIRHPMIPPNQFENIASLDVIPNEEKVPPKMPLLHIKPLNLDEWKKAPISGDISKSFENILEPSKRRRSHHSRHSKIRRSGSRIKIEKFNHFIEEFIQYGYEIDVINSQSPICIPIHHIKINSKHSIKLDFNSEMDDHFIDTFLQFTYSPEQLLDIMKSRMANGETFMENFENYIHNISKIKHIFSMRYYVEFKYEQRISHLFNSFIVSNQNTHLFHTFISQYGTENIFYEFIQCLLLTIKSDFVLYRLEDTNQLSQQINFYYLLNIFNGLILKCKNANLSLDITQVLHVLTYDLLKQLNNEEMLNEIRTKNLKMLMMLLQCNSIRIHELILGDNYIKWLNDLSKSKNGSLVIQTIIHGDALLAASKIFMDHCSKMITSDIVQELTKSTCYLLKSINRIIIKRNLTLKIPFDAIQFLKVLELTAISDDEDVVSISESLASILTMSSLIKNYKETTFQTFLVKTVVMICKGLKTENSSVYHEQIKALQILARDINSSLAMSQIKSFMENVAAHFLDSNPAIAQKSWNFFLQLTSNQTVLSDVLSIPDVKKVLTTIVNKENMTALKNLVVFSIMIFKGIEANNLKKQLIDIITPSIGRLVTMFKMRNTIFKDNVQMQKLIVNFIDVVEKLKGPEFNDFS